MNISLKTLNRIIEEQLPAPGSINFQNCQPTIEIPIDRVIGWLELGVEDDPSGMESGGHELIKERDGKLVFHKSGQDWTLEVFCTEELKYAIERTKAIVTDQMNKQRSDKGIQKRKRSNTGRSRGDTNGLSG